MKAKRLIDPPLASHFRRTARGRSRRPAVLRGRDQESLLATSVRYLLREGAASTAWYCHLRTPVERLSIHKRLVGRAPLLSACRRDGDGLHDPTSLRPGHAAPLAAHQVRVLTAPALRHPVQEVRGRRGDISGAATRIREAVHVIRIHPALCASGSRIPTFPSRHRSSRSSHPPRSLTHIPIT